MAAAQVTRLTRSASRKVGQRGPFAIQNFPIGQNRHTAAAPHEDDCSRKPGPPRASQSKATTEMASDSSNSVSVGLGQLVVEGRGLVGTVEYTLLETIAPSGSRISDLTVADVLFSNGGSFPCSIAGVGHCKATLVPRPK